MSNESILRDRLATCTRILAMQGLLGLFGHVSVYQPESRRILISPGGGGDKANLQAADLAVIDPDGKVLDGTGPVPAEWPIHTCLHAARDDALAVAHLHAPYSTLFAVARREFHPVTLQAAPFAGGLPVYPEAQLITTPDRGQRLARLMGDKRAVLLRAHGIAVIGRDIEEMLYGSLVLEDDARKATHAATLGEIVAVTDEECRAFRAEMDLSYLARRAWYYFSQLEQRWDRQAASAVGPLA
jgi:ribulose-5-phosphate 4-epimerase/fuculose-1-phosphate aldolase